MMHELERVQISNDLGLLIAKFQDEHHLTHFQLLCFVTEQAGQCVKWAEKEAVKDA